MALPISRNETYGVNSPVKSADLNDIQDNIIAGKHGAIDVMLHPTPSEVISGSATRNINHWLYSSGTVVIGHPIDLPVGTRVDAIKVYCEQSTDDQVSAEPFKTDVDTDVTADSIAASKLSGAGAGHKEIDFTSADSGIPFTITAGKTYHLKISLLAGAATRYKGTKLTIVKP